MSAARALGVPGPLLATVRTIWPVLHPALFAAGAAGPTDAEICRMLGPYTVVARPERVRAAVRMRSAVYVTYDSRRQCRYVGSVVRRADPSAVASRVAEHYREPRGLAKRQTWAYLVALGLHADLDDAEVRYVEGRVAFGLSPIDGSLHPSWDPMRAIPQPSLQGGADHPSSRRQPA